MREKKLNEQELLTVVAIFDDRKAGVAARGGHVCFNVPCVVRFVVFFQ